MLLSVDLSNVKYTNIMYGFYRVSAPIECTENGETVTLYGVYDDNTFCIYPYDPFKNSNPDLPEPLVVFDNVKYEYMAGNRAWNCMLDAFGYLFKVCQHSPFTVCSISMDDIKNLWMMSKRQD